MKRPSPSLAVSILALVVASSGTAYAVNTIRGSDVVDESLTGADTRDGSLQFKDLSGIAQRKLKGDRGAPGTNGTDGADGAQGQQGVRGPAGVGRWILINADGSIGGQSGGFSLVTAYPTLGPTETDPAGLRANGNVYINANEPLDDNGIVATLRLQNTVNIDGGSLAGRDTAPDSNAGFSGEITVSPCNVGAPTTPASGPTNCAPAGAQNASSFVVSPRLSDGGFTRAAIADDPATTGVDESQPSNRKAFYVVITGDSTDFVEPTPAP